MKKPLSFFLFPAVAMLAATAFASEMPTLDVMVSDANGKLAYKGKTSGGSFATPTLPTGEYTVQLNSKGALSGNYALVVAAGKQKTVSEAVSGSTFSKGGVAMRIKVGSGVGITGQVTDGEKAHNLNSKVKIMNGKRMVWQPQETGSNMGGRWVEEGSVMASGVLKGKGGNRTQMSDGVSVGR